MSSRVFITGASSGIGAALATCYAKEGAVLGLCARRLAPMEELLSSLGSEGACYQAEVTDSKALQAAASDFIARFGPPDIVIANAGIGAGTLTESAEDLDVFRSIMDTNVLGIVTTFQPFVAAMRERAAGTLVGIASVAGLRGLPGNSAYSASKSAVINYLEGLRVELHGSGISVVTICPGYIRTPLTEHNRYRMPFLIDADDAARRMARVIAAKRRFAVIPWQMALVAIVLRRVPRWLYDRLFARAPRKARGLRR